MSDFDPWSDLLDDFPPTDPNPFLIFQFLRNSPMPMATQASEVRATPEQLNLQPGDWTVALMTNSPLNSEIAVCQIKDPAEYSGRFPDWEDRLLNSWMLTEWVSTDDRLHQPHLGWYERTRLLPVTEEEATGLIEQFEQFDREDDPDIPQWLMDRFAEHVSKIAETDPDKVTAPLECGVCGSREVYMHGASVRRLSVKAGRKKIDGKMTVVPLDDEPDIDHQVAMHLHCQACDSRKELDEDEYHVHQ